MKIKVFERPQDHPLDALSDAVQKALGKGWRIDAQQGYARYLLTDGKREILVEVGPDAVELRTLRH